MEDNMSGLEICSSNQEGFKPLIDFGSWRVALSNGPSVYERKEIKSLSRHLETDEVFALLKGSCLMLTAGNGDAPGKITKTWMEIGQLYNVTKATWHGTILMPGTTVLIVENNDVGPGNSETRDILETISV